MRTLAVFVFGLFLGSTVTARGSASGYSQEVMGWAMAGLNAVLQSGDIRCDNGRFVWKDGRTVDFGGSVFTCRS